MNIKEKIKGLVMKVYMSKKEFQVDLKVNVNDRAPDFHLVDANLKKVSLSDIKSDFIVISTYPSVDTGTCSAQVRRFNEESTNMTSTTILNISCDLPFALKRFCGANGIDNVKTYSDYNKHSFGNAYGLLIDKLQLLTRSILILDKERTIKYIQVVKNVSDQVNFDEALNKLKELVTK